MWPKLMTLAELQRGGAWSSSVRTVRRSVKSDNEQDPYPQLPLPSPDGEHIVETATAKVEEGSGNDRSVCPEFPGLHARYKDHDNGHRRREAKAIPKRGHSSDRGLQLALVKLDSVVIASQNGAVNMPLLLAHTARQTI
jgi:hypothetical protein